MHINNLRRRFEFLDKVINPCYREANVRSIVPKKRIERLLFLVPT